MAFDTSISTIKADSGANNGYVPVFNSTTKIFDLVTPTGFGAMAIGGTITGATAGSVLFAGVAGILAQDNTNFFWDNANNFLGIGSNTPGTYLDVGLSGDVILTGGPTIATVFRQASRYTSVTTTGSSIGALAYANQANGTTGNIQAFQGFTHTSNSTGTVALAVGISGFAETTGAGVTTSLRGVQGNITTRSSGGGTDAAAFYANPGGRVGSGSGTYTNGYGLYVGTFGTGYTNKYGVFVADATADNQFAGTATIGGTFTNTASLSIFSASVSASGHPGLSMSSTNTQVVFGSAQVETNSRFTLQANPNGYIAQSIQSYSNDTSGQYIIFYKNRSVSSPIANNIVNNGDDLGTIAFKGSSNAAFLNSSYIVAQVDGTPSNTAMPGRLTFWTSPAGTVAPTEKMRIDNAGNVGIGTTTIPSMLTVNGLINMKNYTVATLPAGTRGDIAYVTDALTPTFLAIVVGGGAVVTPVFFNGTNWVGF